jgi:glycerophosphoryl diester phosphodiesterase
MDGSNILLVRETFTMVRKKFSDFILIHTAYTALGFTLFAPLMGALVKLLLKVSSKQILADTDILFFLLSPYGITALLIFGALLITIIIFELSSMMLLYTTKSGEQYLGLLHALGFTAARAVTIFKFSFHFTIRVTLIVLPFLAVAGMIGWLSLTKYDINYYLSAKPPIFWIAGAAIILILLSMIFFLINNLLDWSLTLPLVLFKDVDPGKSFSASRFLVATKKKRTARILIYWGLGVLLISLIVFGFIELMTYFFLPLFYHSMNLLILVIGVLIVVWFVVNLLATSLFSASFSGILVEFLTNYDSPIDTVQYAEVQPVDKPFLTRPRVFALAIIGIVAAVAISFSLLDDIQAADDLIIVAHRGAAGKAPENTLASVKQAMEDKTDWVEIDVQESRDGYIVVVHDSDFMKLAKNDLKVWDGTLAQIQAIDIGSWFSSDFSDERVPLLKDVLKAAKGKAKVVIELKYYGHDQYLEQRVVDIVEEMDMVNDIAIMSLKYEGIQKVRKLRPDWTIGLLSAQVLGNMNAIDADFLAVNASMAKPAFIRTSQEAGKKVFVWTVNDKMAMFRLMSLGVDGIITDEPALARRVIAERAELSSLERLLIHTAVLFGKNLPQKKYRDESP